ncbi:PAS domain S-box protein [Nitrincola tapanii]|uniref:histidine kinase n=1 Tax=Nitrincola tapanii TaxID=1708751 RepID=A0A5A9W4J2_9GAMM|nr:PAS domain S-box protein [Nitrincola tapanii]KAA0875686.1 PAS domain S-box protein [Nitrincola tapanii]
MNSSESSEQDSVLSPEHSGETSEDHGRSSTQFTPIWQLVYEREREHLALDHHSLVTYADHQGRITHANDLFCEISGFSRGELIGQTHSLLKSGVHPDSFYRSMWADLKAGQVWQGDICNRRKNGSLHWVRTTIVPFLNQRGEIYQFISMRTDISHIKQIEEDLREARDLAQQAQRQAESSSLARANLLRKINHDIRTPLTSILSAAQLLEMEGGLSESQTQCAQRILNACQEVLGLITPIADQDEQHSRQLWSDAAHHLSSQLYNTSEPRQHLVSPKAPPSSSSSNPISTELASDNAQYPWFRILYVEENSANRQLVRLLLERNQDVKLYSTPSVEEALELAATYQPHLILVDLNLPGIEISDLQQQLRQHLQPGTAMIALSALDDDEAVQWLRKGFQGHLKKPLELPLLLRTLDHWMQEVKYLQAGSVSTPAR